MGKKFTETHQVVYYECDTTGQMRLPMMINCVIKSSEEQSDALGRDKSFISKYGLTWVITHYDIQVSRFPKNGEQIAITTEADSYNKYFCYRNFWIHDNEGKECAKIESVFALMGIDNRKLASVPEEIIAPFESEKITKIKRSPKIIAPSGNQSLNYRVRFADIDGNRHVNNSRYFEWMLDVLGYDFLTSHNLQQVSIKFDKEVEYGNEIESYWDLIEEEEVVSRHQIKIGNQLCAEASMKWTK